MQSKNKDEHGIVHLVPLSEEWFDTAKVTKSARLHLMRSLNGLLKERAHTPSFPLYGSRDAKVIIKKFLDSLDWDSFDLPKGVKEYEYDRLKKVGPQGGHPSWAEIEPLFYLYQERLAPVSKVSERSMKVIHDEIISCLTSKLQPYNVDVTLARLLATDKIQETAAGCRSFDLKKTDPLAQKLAIADIRSGLFNKFRMYIAERFSKLKPRIFMPGPFSNMIEQAAYILPMMKMIQEGLRNSPDFPLYHFADKIGFDPMFHEIFPFQFSKALKRLRRRLRAMGIRFDKDKLKVLYIQGDFEKMDTTTGTEQYKQLYIPLTRIIFDDKYYEHYASSMIKTTTMPVISPSGVMIGDHGTGSGMENTNNGESWCNLYYGTETQAVFKDYMINKLPHVIYEFGGSYYNGDDSTFTILLYNISDTELSKVKDIFQHAAERVAGECGFRINDKWRMDTEFGLYNQNVFFFKISDDGETVSCTYWYPATLILNSIMNPEKEYTSSTWDKDYRDIDITEKLDNGRYLPYFYQLVDFVDNGMKFRLYQRSEQALTRILSKYDKYRALQQLGERFNRLDYTISNSPTINYILPKLRA